MSLLYSTYDSGSDFANVSERLDPRFALHHNLGSGGFGSVKEVYDKWLRTPVAIKISDTSSLENLRTEVLRLRSLPPQYFVRSFDFGHSEETCWYTMELLVKSDGWHSLDGFSDVMDNLSIGEHERALFALFIIKEIGFGLHALHDNEIDGSRYFHGDIKPGNVFFNVEAIQRWRNENSGPNEPFIKIIDLGASEKCGKPSKVFTRGWMAPEQGGKAACDEKVDSFPMGLLLYYLLCNDLPRPIAQEQQVVKTTTVKTMTTTCGTYLGTKATDIICQCLKVKSDGRVDCLDVAEDLDFLFDNEMPPEFWRLVAAIDDEGVNGQIAKPQLLRLLKEGILQVKGGKKIGKKTHQQATENLKLALSRKLLKSAGHLKVCFA